MKDNQTELKTILRNAREKTGLSATVLASKIDYTRPYVYAVENGTRINPSDKFIHKYLKAVSSNTDEYNELLKKIVQETGFKTELKPIGKFNNDSLIQAFTDVTSAPNMLYLSDNGIIKQQFFNEPLNDLKHHLNDNLNKKYFNSIELDHSDIDYISKLIENYLLQKMEIQKNVIENRYQKEEISKLIRDEYIHDTNKVIEILKVGNPYKK